LEHDGCYFPFSITPVSLLIWTNSGELFSDTYSRRSLRLRWLGGENGLRRSMKLRAFKSFNDLLLLELENILVRGNLLSIYS
jgi:hypothetical protein